MYSRRRRAAFGRVRSGSRRGECEQDCEQGGCAVRLHASERLSDGIGSDPSPGHVNGCGGWR